MIKQLIYVDKNNNNIHQYIKICGQNDFLNIPFLWGFRVVNIFKNYYKFAHELMHLVVSLITFGKPTWFSILPSKTINNNGQVLGYTLGYVKSKNIRWYNVALISLAPLLLIPLSYLIYTDFFNYIDRNLYSYILYIFIIISLLFSSIPSSVDFRNIFNGFKTILNFVPLGMVCILLYINHYGF